MLINNSNFAMYNLLLNFPALGLGPSNTVSHTLLKRSPFRYE